MIDPHPDDPSSSAKRALPWVALGGVFIAGLLIAWGLRWNFDPPGANDDGPGQGGSGGSVIGHGNGEEEEAQAGEAEISALPGGGSLSLTEWPEAEEAQAASADLGSDQSDLPTRGRTVTFASAEELRRFLELAREAGLNVSGVIDGLYAVRVEGSGEDFAALDQLLKDEFPNAQLADNFLLETPPAPDSRELADSGAFLPSGLDTLRQLGLPADINLGAGVKIAVLDSGVAAHEAFGETGMPALIDLLGENAGELSTEHGTAVASIITGDVPGAIGAAPSSEVTVYRVLDGQGVGDAFTVAQGVLAAVDAGAQIINLSIGGYGDSAVLRQAVEYAAARNVVLVAAAGNESYTQLAYPAAYPQVIGVSAVDRKNQILPFSNVGEGLSISAPGFGVPAAYGAGDQFALTSGTSFSAPFVTGTIAATMSSQRLGAREAADLVIASAYDSGRAGPDTLYGTGVVSYKPIANRGTRGIYDMGIAGQVLGEVNRQGTATKLYVAIQNRGTEIVPQSSLNVTVGKLKHTFTFSGLKPGESTEGSISVPFGQFSPAGEIRIESVTRVVGRDEFDPSDNRSVSVLRRLSSE